MLSLESEQDLLESFCTDDRLVSCTESGGKLVLVAVEESCRLLLKCCCISILRSILTTSVGGLISVDVLLLLWMSGGLDRVWAVPSLLYAWVVGRGAHTLLALGPLAGGSSLQLVSDTVRVPSATSRCSGVVVLWG